jgi:hypothetical protein
VGSSNKNFLNFLHHRLCLAMQDLPDDIYYCFDYKYLHRNGSQKPVHIPGVHFITDPSTGKVHRIKQPKVCPNSKHPKSASTSFVKGLE